MTRGASRKAMSRLDPNREVFEHTGRLNSCFTSGFSRAVRAIVFVAACTIASGIGGCVVPLQGTVKQTDEGSGIVRENASDEKSARLIKPMIPPEDTESPGERNQSTAGPPPKPALQTSPKGEPPRTPKGEWEDQKVKNAALEMARVFPSVVKIRVCYAVDDDEWLVTLYDDIGTAIDLKQYTWSREQEKLEPYLVLKRIPRGQLKADIARKKQGTACEVIDPPRPTPLTGAPTEN